MMTLSPFLKRRSGRDGDGAQRRAENLERIVGMLLQGIARNGFRYDCESAETFGKAVSRLRSEFEDASDEAIALLAAGGAIRLMEEHHAAAERHLAARQRESDSVIRMLSETLLEVTGAAMPSMAGIRKLEQEFCLATGREEREAARNRLTEYLGSLRAEAAAEPAIDRLTGLPDAGFATAALNALWNRRQRSWLAAFSLERMESVSVRFGAEAGEQMLVILARHLTQLLRPGDQLFRWRGACLLMLVERNLPEPLVAAELARAAPVRLESALTVRGREAMVPVSAAWSLFSLGAMSNIEELFRRVNEFACSGSRPPRKVSAAAV